MSRRAVVTLAAVTLVAGVFVSEARAAGKCTNNTCAEEIAAACAGLSGMNLSNCRKSVVSNCKTNPNCSCDGSVSPPCGPTTTTTSSSTTTTSSSTTNTSSSTATTTSSSTTTTSTSTTTTSTQSPGGAF